MSRPSGALHVLHLCEPTHAGSARVAFNLADRLRSDGFESTVCTPPGDLAQWCRAADIPVVTLPFARRSPRTYRPTWGMIRDGVDNGGFSLIHAHSSFAGVFARLLRRPGGTPVVFQPHAWSFLALDGAGQRAAVGVERGLAPRTDLLICVSPEERELADEAGIHARSTVVITNGVDFDGPATPRGPLRARPLVGCAARLTHQKGVDVLLRAVADARWPENACLEIAGDGPLAADLRALVDELGITERVRFLGQLPDITARMAKWDLFILPARYEGASIAFLEAVSAGLPVVCTAVAGVGSLTDARRPPVAIENPAALAAGVADALAGWEVTCDAARVVRGRAEREYSLAAQLHETAAAYRNLLGSRAQAS
jgi:glycosyltransferase involved in cell wall biosynthesis